MNENTKSTLRALVVEDSEDDAHLLIRHLARAGYEISHQQVESPDELRRALEGDSWDVVFGDYTMPKFLGSEALSIVRQHDSNVPFIFVSGTIGEETAVEAMRLGAQDYVMKDRLERLAPALDRELREAERRREHRHAQLEAKLLHDIVLSAADSADLPTALSSTLHRVCQALQWPLAQAWVPNADGTILECGASWWSQDVFPETLKAFSSGPLTRGEGLPGRVWASRRHEWVRDPSQDPRIGPAHQANERAITAALAIPILAHGDVIGVIEFLLDDYCEDEDRSLRLITGVAAQLGGIMQRKRAEEELHFMAHHDSLTGLPNRVLFEDRLQQALLEAHRNKQLLCVGLLDLDRFKTVNDSLGHDVGDRLLQTVAQRLQNSVRESDTVARPTGDEFTLILSNLQDSADAANVARKLLDSIAQPCNAGDHDVFPSASIGLALYPTDGTDTAALLRNADIAMYRAKERGGNSYECYAVEMTAKVQARLNLETSLRRAFERDEFLLHYQPLVDVASGGIVAVEALIRWQHPDKGMIAPREFIPVAEETGLIVELGNWVIREACSHIEALPAAAFGESPLRLAVNVSPMQFLRGDLCRSIELALAGTSFDADRLDLEITESLLMRNPETSLEMMRHLGGLGVSFSVDDFGTGYSSLSYLKHLPIRSLKIDQSFVHDVPDDPNDAAIIAAIISMARTLGLQVIAEGVETAEQEEFLKQHSCDMWQGFRFSAPVPLDELVELLRSTPPREDPAS